MPQLIKPHEVRVVTQQGECTVSIVLELNINLNADGVKVAARTVSPETPEDKVEWAIPDFTSSKIKFGKYQEE
jgi:hypothetical protein